MTSSFNQTNEAHLATRRFPTLRFGFEGWDVTHLSRIWSLLRHGDHRSALVLSKESLEAHQVRGAEEQSALLIAHAAAEFRVGSTDLAKRHAGKALDLFPAQWSAHRILLSVSSANRDFKAAYMHLSNLDPGPVPLWDEPMSKTEIHTALASWSWLLGDWELVAKHLQTAYPKGIATMPEAIQEDWFRLSLYRDRPEDAVAVASVLIEQRPVASTDELLQTFVQNGWTKQALPLYRAAFKSAPNSELLRRRLVALCIREGALEEARNLTKPGALDLAA